MEEAGMGMVEGRGGITRGQTEQEHEEHEHEMYRNQEEEEEKNHDQEQGQENSEKELEVISIGMSRNKQRKLMKYERAVGKKKEGRKEEQRRHRERYKQQRQEGGLAKDQIRKVQLGRLLEARQGGLRVGVDLQFEQLMNDKELNQLANQLKRVYGSNKASPDPFHLHLLNLDKTGKTFRTCCEKIAGFEQFVVTFEERSVREAFDPSEVVYLSPDSDNVLERLDPSKVYMIGGLVDDSVKKDTSRVFSSQSGMRTARLPIAENMARGTGTFKQVLTVNQVFDTLLKFHETADWAVALAANVPSKTGFVLKEALVTDNPQGE